MMWQQFATNIILSIVVGLLVKIVFTLDELARQVSQLP